MGPTWLQCGTRVGGERGILTKYTKNGETKRLPTQTQEKRREQEGGALGLVCEGYRQHDHMLQLPFHIRLKKLQDPVERERGVKNKNWI